MGWLKTQNAPIIRLVCVHGIHILYIYESLWIKVTRIVVE